MSGGAKKPEHARSPAKDRVKLEHNGYWVKTRVSASVQYQSRRLSQPSCNRRWNLAGLQIQLLKRSVMVHPHLRNFVPNHHLTRKWYTQENAMPSDNFMQENHVCSFRITSVVTVNFEGWERKRSKCFFIHIHLDLFGTHPLS